MSKNIFVALESYLEKAIEIVNKIKDYAYGFKIGMTLFNQIGQEGLKKFDNLQDSIHYQDSLFPPILLFSIIYRVKTH